MALLTIEVFKDLFDLGYTPIPLIWNEQTRQAEKHPEHDTAKVELNLAYVEKLMCNGFARCNGIALKLFPPFGMFDFDLKNTKNQMVYHDWLRMVNAVNDNILNKVCIETTRSGGYHVFIKYAGLRDKIPVARCDGKEVISVYTGGLLSYCYPSPGYQLTHNDFSDVEELSTEEFDLLLSCAAYFNEDQDHKPGESTIQLIEYPVEYESVCLQFDRGCTDDLFEKLLNSIELFRVKDDRLFSKKKFVPFLRAGSTASYSAKAYFKSKRLLIFSASMKGFPTWHDSAKSGDNRWSLSPSKILYYQNNRNWLDTIEDIKGYDRDHNLGINFDKPAVKTEPESRLRFPYDIFPEPVQDFISCQVIQHEYLAGGILGALSTMIGNSAVLHAMDGYQVKTVLYIVIVAPPGASKTPALKKAFEPLERIDAGHYTEYAAKMQEYKELLALYESDKKKHKKPDKPEFQQLLIKDSTIEMVVKILSFNPSGCCVLADELSGFLNRMNQYKDGDEVQKWLEMWSGAPILLQRISRDENKIEDPFCNVIGGIQPGVLEALSKGDNTNNGHFHRYLYIYPAVQPKIDWQPITVPQGVKEDYFTIFQVLWDIRKDDQVIYHLSPGAGKLYADWFNRKNEKYNQSYNDHHKGIIAKYQDYCLRFALLLQVVYDGYNRGGVIHPENMERAIRLTDYFSSNMFKAMRLLVPDCPADKLRTPYAELYTLLPEIFSCKVAVAEGAKYGLKESAIKMFLNRNLKTLFTQTERGIYEKLY